MKSVLNVVQGELERLFSLGALKAICQKYFDLDVDSAGIYNENKVLFVRNVVEYCERHNQVLALADVIQVEKKGMVDPRLKHVYAQLSASTIGNRDEIEGFRIGDRVASDDLYALFSCESHVDEDAEENGDGSLQLQVVHAHHLRDIHSANRFVTVYRLVQSLSCLELPHVIRSGLLEDGRPYLLMKAPGGTKLSEMVPMQGEDALCMLEAIAAVLEKLDSIGLVHGDIRPDNIWVQDSVEWKYAITILGVGADRLRNASGWTSSVSMTQYMAPDVLRGDEPCLSSEFYALGCTLYFLLSGKEAFSGRRAVDVAASHIHGRVESLDELLDEPIPSAMKHLVLSLLSRDPNERPRDLPELRRLIDDARREMEDSSTRTSQKGTLEDIEEQLIAFREDPRNERVASELLDACEVYGAFPVLLSAAEDMVAGTTDTELAYSVLLLAADVAGNRLRDYERAAALYEQLSEMNPSDATLLDARVRTYRKLKNYDAVLQLLGMRAEMTEEPQAKIGILLQMATLLEKEAGEPDKAFDYYAHCLTGQEQDRDIILAMEAIARRSERIPELAQMVANVATVAEQSGNVAMTVFLYGKLSQWYRHPLNQPAYALTCCQKIVQLESGHTEALDQMMEIYRSAQQWVELSQVMLQRADKESQPDVRRQFMCDVAGIYWERLSEVNEARNILTGVLSEDPGCFRAVALLRKIYEKTGDYENLAQILEIITVAMNPGQEAAMEHFYLAEIYELHLKKTKEAQTHYEAAIKMEPTHMDSLKGLERIHSLKENHSGLKDVLELQFSVAVTAKQKIALLERLAAIYEEEFKDSDKAIEAYQRIVEIDNENVLALQALTRLFRRLKRFAELSDVLHRRAHLCDSDSEKREHLTERVKIIKEELQDAEEATRAINELAALGGSGSDLEQIIRSQIELGELNAAEQTYRRMLEMETAQDVRVRILIELAAFQVEKQGNQLASEATLNEARDLDPDNADVISELAELLSNKGDYAGAVELLKKKIDLVEGTKKRADVYSRIGRIALEKMKNSELALEYLERAVAADNSHVEASDRLAGLYRQQGRWDDAIGIYERWVPSAAVLSRDSQLELFLHAGEAYVTVGRKEKALELFRKASELASEPSLIWNLGNLALEMGQFELAATQFAKYAEETPELDNEKKVELSVKRGRAEYGREHFDEAAKLARQATVMAPENVEARILLADVHEARKDYRGAVEARQKVLDSLDSLDSRWFDIVRSTATLLFEKLRNAEGAAALLENALKTESSNRDVLGELLKIYYAAKDYQGVVKTILRMAEKEEDTVKLSRYYLTVAKIYRRELGQPEDAVTFFRKALENDSGLEDARTALIQVLTDRKDWRGLEGVYKEIIAGWSTETTLEEKLEVFQPLVELYTTKMERESDAIVLLETISKLQPEKIEWLERLSELYGWNPGTADKAIDIHQRLLRGNITRVESFRMLYRIFSALEDPDRAWCVASILSLLNQASPEERQYYRDYLPEGYPPIQEVVSDEYWLRHLYHEDMNVDITNIFSVIISGITAAKCHPLQSTGLNPKTAVNPTTDPAEFSILVNFGLGITATPPMPLFYQTDQQGFGILETNPLVMFAGGDAADMRDYLGLAFRLGQELTLLRPGLLAKKLLKSGTELSSWLLAAVKLFVPQLPVPSNLVGPVNEKLQPIRASLNPGDNDRLQAYVQSFVANAGDVNMKRWARAIDYTGDRAGLILCGDIAVARRIIESQVSEEKEKAERIRALSLYLVSDDYFSLRKKLGVALSAG